MLHDVEIEGRAMAEILHENPEDQFSFKQGDPIRYFKFITPKSMRVRIVAQGEDGEHVPLIRALRTFLEDPVQGPGESLFRTKTPGAEMGEHQLDTSHHVGIFVRVGLAADKQLLLVVYRPGDDGGSLQVYGAGRVVPTVQDYNFLLLHVVLEILLDRRGGYNRNIRETSNMTGYCQSSNPTKRSCCNVKVMPSSSSSLE